MQKVCNTYDEAYQLYSDILSGRDPDREYPSIVMDKYDRFVVVWKPKKKPQ
jgi:hypothetical protein